MDANKLYALLEILDVLRVTIDNKHVLDKSIGACTDNHAASTYARNSKDIASKARYILC